MELKLNEFAQEVHENAKAHGFWDEEPTFGDLVSLLHSEASEALEEFRHGHEPTETYYSCEMEEKRLDHDSKQYVPAVPNHRSFHRLTSPVPTGLCKKPEGIPSELADIVIRVLDIAARKGIDIEKAILEKHEYNKTRPYKHGGKKI
jgi:NTP pyrophosphatase (non-canonical NTP hydrolase)